MEVGQHGEQDTGVNEGHIAETPRLPGHRVANHNAVADLTEYTKVVMQRCCAGVTWLGGGGPGACVGARAK